MIKRVLKWIFYITLTLVIGLGASLYLFKDRIIKQVMNEVNNYLSVPIQVSKVDIDFLHGIPNVSVAFYEVELLASNTPIIAAEKVYVILNPLQILRSEIDIARIEVQDAEFTIYIDHSNANNLGELFKPLDQSGENPSDTVSTGFNLNAIKLKNVKLNYVNDFTGSKSTVMVNHLDGDLKLLQGSYYSTVVTEVNYINHKTKTWNAADIGIFNYDFDLSFNVERKVLDLNESNLKFRGANAMVSGNVSFGDTPKTNLHVNASDIKFNLLADLLPSQYAKVLADYKSSGEINFEADLIGNITRNTLPSLEAIVELKNVDLTEKEYDANIQGLDMISKLSIKDLANLSTASFDIESGKGTLQSRPFDFSFHLKNLLKPTYNGKLNGNVETSWLLGILRFPLYTTGAGSIDFALDFLGNQKSDNFLDNLQVGGGLDFDEISFSLNDSVNIEKLDGTVRFDEEIIQLTNLKLNWLESDVTINGDIIDHITNDGLAHQLVLRSDINSAKLEIEDIVNLIKGTTDYFSSDSTVNSNLNIDLELVAKFDSLKFKRFRGSKIAGDILYQDNILEISDLSGRAMGGAIRLNGKLKEMPNQDIVIQAQAQTKGVNIDSLFYVFNNFSQNFIREEHLSGRVYAEVDASMYFDKDWRFRRQLLTSTAKIGIAHGELINFEPIMALSAYLDDKDDDLAKLMFSDIVNNILIRQDTVFIPEMSIRTNVRNIALGGYHTLDQHINYQLAVPIINERVDKDEAYGAVQKSSGGSPNLLFRIKGTTSDYRVNYDLLRATGNVLKLLDITKIFKKKQEVETDTSFLDDEDFDWKQED